MSENPTRVNAENLNGGRRFVARPAFQVTRAMLCERTAAARRRYATIASVTQTIEAPVRVERPEQDEDVRDDRPWIVIVWNDPVNLKNYVTWVFQKLFGYSRAKAEELMLQVHHEGRAVVSNGTREKAEYDVARLHAHGLWATMRQD